MRLSAIERIAIVVAFVCVAYRAIYDRWPVAVEVEADD